VQVRTRRSNLAEDTDPTGWFFETEGVGAFDAARQRYLVAAGHGGSLQLKDEFITMLLEKRAATGHSRAEDETFSGLVSMKSVFCVVLPAMQV